MRARAVVVGLAVIVLAVAAAPASPAATARRETRSYVAGGSDLVLASATARYATGVDVEREAACAGAGGACVGLRPGETSIRLSIADDAGGPVSGTVRFTDGAGRTLAPGWAPFCRTGAFDVPRRAAVAIVTVGVVVSCSAYHPGTTGIITAVIR